MNQQIKYIFIAVLFLFSLFLTGCRDFDESFLELEQETPEMTEPGIWTESDRLYFDASYTSIGFELRALGGKWTLTPKEEYGNIIDYSPKSGEDGNFIVKLQVEPNNSMLETEMVFIIKQEATNVVKEITLNQFTHESKFTRETDSLALIKMSEALNMQVWRNQWEYRQPMETWAGVKLEEVRGEMRVVELEMNDYSMYGTIPLELGRLRELRLLKMSGRNLSGGIPSTFSSLRNLSTVDIQFSDRDKFFVPENMGNMLSLKSLSLGGINIFYFENLYKLPELEEFICSGVSGELKEGISGLEKLKVLDLSMSTVEKLPQDIGGMKSLEELDISYCSDLSSLPESFGELQAFKTLKIRSSGLKTLPSNIGNIPTLEAFALNNCDQLETLPESFSKIPFTGELTLSGCSSLKALPEGIGEMRGITKLNLSSCKSLVTLPVDMGEYIVDLNLNSCTNITELPTSLSEMKQLKVLNLSSTGITSLPESFGDMGALEELTFNSSKLTSLPASMGNLSSLKKWTMTYPSSESILCDGEILNKLTSLEVINVAKCTFDNAGLDWLEKMKNLTSLKINQSKMGGEINWSNLPSSLTSLDLSENNITGTLDGIGSINQKLTSITLSNNLLDGDIPESIAQCVKLSRLVLQNNNITGTVPAGILSTGLTGYGALNLNGNRMSGEIPPAVLNSTMWSRWSYAVVTQQEGYGFSNVNK